MATRAPPERRPLRLAPVATMLRALLPGADGLTEGERHLLAEWLDRGLRRLGLTLKKTLAAAEQDRPDIAAARRAWGELASQLDPGRPIFIDETWTKTNMTRLRAARSAADRRVPHGHWRTSTFLAGLRHNGIVAPLVLDGAINGEAFRAWVEQFLASKLSPGDIVIADNLGSRKVSGVRKAIEARGASLMFLPPYSPGLNPIEHAFAKLKALIRKAEPRTREALRRRIGSIVNTSPASQCANMLSHCGYTQSG